MICSQLECIESTFNSFIVENFSQGLRIIQVQPFHEFFQMGLVPSESFLDQTVIKIELSNELLIVVGDGS